MKKTLVAFGSLLAICVEAVPVSARVASPAYFLDSEEVKADTIVTMKDVTVIGNSKKEAMMRTSMSSVQIDRNYLQHHFSGSLMQTLSHIPGVKAMSIGSGQSKPAIRGLGFNRMVVAQNGIKHEGQQWGDDHGLEIDQFAIDRIEVLKGPAALLYGSDAIGGVVNLYSNFIPTKPFQGAISVYSRSNNASIGASARLEGSRGGFFWRSNFTFIDYADYKVPTDSIQYYSYYIRLKDKRLRNTAGTERNAGVTLGYKTYRFKTDLRLSNTYAKSGFFANAHGIEVRLSDIDYDRSIRDIDLPLQRVNHFQAVSNSWYKADRYKIEANLSYQHNKRSEHSEPVAHGYMPKPSSSLEREFEKRTYSGNIVALWELAESHNLTIGGNLEYQHNRRGGWGFIIPDFETFAWGFSAAHRYNVNKDFSLNAGVRYDNIRTHIHSYFDWYKTPISASDSIFKERSVNLKRNFSNLTWSLGLNLRREQWLLKANIGKSFRVPIAKELGADGVNYNIFRYEKGNATLRPEASYQLDLGIHWDSKAVEVEVNPFINYFPNYIYMNPTPLYKEGLQLYEYTQSRVFRWGMELNATWNISSRLQAELKGEYLFARQLSGEKKGYSLPFSTPWSIDAGLCYLYGKEARQKEDYLMLHTLFVGSQNDIVPPEKPTTGYYTINFSVGKTFLLAGRKMQASLRIENLLNKKYYDHTSYYRLIDVPEPGRNIAMMIEYKF